MKEYKPSKKILENYAKVMVDFAVGNEKGIKKEETVYLLGGESSKPLYASIAAYITKRGGNIIHGYYIDDPQYPVERDFLDAASGKQLDYLTKKHFEGLYADADHMIFIISEPDKKALAGIDPKKIMRRRESQKYDRELRTKKELEGKFSWTMCLYGTESMAKEAGLSIQQYWKQIADACFLKEENPVQKWKETVKENKRVSKKMNSMSIQEVHVHGKDVDLKLKLSDKAAWKTGGGSNIPSFEIFTSPDWRGTEGWIRFNQPLYRYGSLVEGIYLEFKEGRVTKATATKNQKLLREMIATKNADKLGEFSLTDSRASKITRFMAETLYDENVGGRYGNTHVAVGTSFRDCYKGDPSKLSEDDWEKLGYNKSSVHTDLISTADRIVTVTFGKNKKKVIYKDGKFTI